MPRKPNATVRTNNWRTLFSDDEIRMLRQLELDTGFDASGVVRHLIREKYEAKHGALKPTRPTKK